MNTLKQLISGELKGAKQIRLSCGLTDFPEELFSLAETLEILDLSGNKLSILPEDFGKLSRLKIAFFSENQFTQFPEVLVKCPLLTMIGFKSNKISEIPENTLPVTTRWLILTNNKITSLPKSIGKCLPLQKVALAGNLLTTLPSEMAHCKNLELLRISANQLTGLPEWLLDLPKLSWLAFSGNPFTTIKLDQYNLIEIDWKEFEIADQLGEGASGHIYKAFWNKENDKQAVAIKVFKGEVTSDGFPEDEMRASIAAGKHTGLVGLLGKLKNHINQKKGLVMNLIPPTFCNLGLPPSMETCSRDTFKEGTVFTANQILKIATTIASTANHLHIKGLMHGDLYAHNILVNEKYEGLLSDFGAASFYDLEKPSSIKIQQIECRAFGCLMDDLLMNLILEDRKIKLTQQLIELKNELMHEINSARPIFKEIVSRLELMNSDC